MGIILSTRNECTICFEPIGRFYYNRGNKATCCNYWYHDRCLLQWNQKHNQCPTCNSLYFTYFKIDNSVVQLTADQLIWSQENDTTVIDFADIHNISLHDQNGHMFMTIKLNYRWVGHTLSISSSDPIVIKKIYDSIAYLTEKLRTT